MRFVTKNATIPADYLLLSSLFDKKEIPFLYIFKKIFMLFSYELKKIREIIEESKREKPVR